MASIFAFLSSRNEMPTDSHHTPTKHVGRSPKKPPASEIILLDDPIKENPPPFSIDTLRQTPKQQKIRTNKVEKTKSTEQDDPIEEFLDETPIKRPVHVEKTYRSPFKSSVQHNNILRAKPTPKFTQLQTTTNTTTQPTQSIQPTTSTRNQDKSQNADSLAMQGIRVSDSADESEPPSAAFFPHSPQPIPKIIPHSRSPQHRTHTPPPIIDITDSDSTKTTPSSSTSTTPSKTPTTPSKTTPSHSSTTPSHTSTPSPFSSIFHPSTPPPSKRKTPAARKFNDLSPPRPSSPPPDFIPLDMESEEKNEKEVQNVTEKTKSIEIVDNEEEKDKEDKEEKEKEPEQEPEQEPEPEKEDKKEAEEEKRAKVDLTEADMNQDIDISLPSDDEYFNYDVKVGTSLNNYNSDDSQSNNFYIDHKNKNDEDNNNNNNNNKNIKSKKPSNKKEQTTSKRKAKELLEVNEDEQPSPKQAKNSKFAKKSKKIDEVPNSLKNPETQFFSPILHFNFEVIVPNIDPDNPPPRNRPPSPPVIYSPLLSTSSPLSPSTSTPVSPAKSKPKTTKAEGGKLQGSPMTTRSSKRKQRETETYSDGDSDFEDPRSPIKVEKIEKVKVEKVKEQLLFTKTAASKPRKGRPPKDFNKNNPIELLDDDETADQKPEEKEEEDTKQEVVMVCSSASFEGSNKYVDSTLVFKPHALILKWEDTTQEIPVNDIFSCTFSKEDNEVKFELTESAPIYRFFKLCDENSDSKVPKSMEPGRTVSAKFLGKIDFDPTSIAALSEAWKSICSKENQIAKKPVTRKDTKEAPPKLSTKKLNEVLATLGVVTVMRYDYNTLEPGEFLNDTIIEFYLKWIHSRAMPDEHRDRFYFFNTFFYEKLNKKSAYKELQSWTAKVDIFAKDFLIIPINETSHWSLYIICHPGAVPDESSPSGQDKEKEKEKDSFKKTPKMGEPCIIYLDSLSTGRKKASAKIRDYLTKEWNYRKAPQGKEKKKVFTEKNLPLYQPVVPHQENFYDCGLFLLHYVEKFALTPDVTLFTKDWFPISEIAAKRKDIQAYINRIYAEQRPDDDSKENENENENEREEMISTASSDSLIMSTQPFESMRISRGGDESSQEEEEGEKEKEGDEKEDEKEGEEEREKEKEEREENEMEVNGDGGKKGEDEEKEEEGKKKGKAEKEQKRANEWSTSLDGSFTLDDIFEEKKKITK